MASRERVLQGEEGDVMTVSPTSSPSGVPGSAAPTTFINAESIAAAASSLSSGQIGAIVAACLVVALIAGGVYLYKKKHSGDTPHYSGTESATLT